MTKSRRKRTSILTRVIPEDELGPNFYSNYKATTLNWLNGELNSLMISMGSLHDIIYDKSKNRTFPQETSNDLHIKLDRAILIEGLIIVDSYTLDILIQYQIRKMGRSIPEIQNYSRVDDGLRECLKNLTLPSSLDKLKIRVSHFRTLRNQYAHYKHGAFAFSANHESFESFLRTLDGINLGDSMHCYIDGKAGVFLPYTITSAKYLGEFCITSIKFIEELLDFIFPTKEQKITVPNSN